jgi:hypothetical protein
MASTNVPDPDATSADTWLVDPVPLVRTYDLRVDDDPLEYVRQYRETMAYAADHPDEGSMRVANAVGLPRSRVKNWLNEGRVPHPVHALKTAHARGWLTSGPDSDVAVALAVLTAGVVASGIVAGKHYQPRVATDRTTAVARLRTALDTLGVGATTHAGDAGGDAELAPARHASQLGRTLVAAGCPHRGEALDGLPSIWTASTATQAAAVTVLAQGQTTSDDDGTTVTFAHSVADDAGLTALLRSVVDERVSVHDEGIWLSTAARHALGLTT